MFIWGMQDICENGQQCELRFDFGFSLQTTAMFNFSQTAFQVSTQALTVMQTLLALFLFFTLLLSDILVEVNLWLLALSPEMNTLAMKPATEFKSNKDASSCSEMKMKPGTPLTNPVS